MTLNRIQKLLFSEYSDFEDMVLVESPFAQTTREGLGLRQVQLGLTPTKLILAIDVLPPAGTAELLWNNIDPEIETLELIAVYPVDCVNLSVYRRRKRQSLKAHFCNNRVFYFELGGHEKRKMFWNLWRERVRFLCPEDISSSVSETSVATSTSTSTLNIISATHKVNESGKPQFWCKFSKSKEHKLDCKWAESVERYLNMDNATITSTKDDYGTEFCPQRKGKKRRNKTVADIKISEQNIKVNNADACDKIGCGTGLFLNTDVLHVPRNELSETSTDSTDACTLYAVVSSQLSQQSENAVKNWEMARNISRSRSRHPRKYGLMPKSHFLYGLGPWNIHTGDRISTQMKRSVSAVRIRRQPDDPELSLPITKRLLTVSISCEAFHMSRGLNVDTCISKLAVPGPKALLFWTPEYWYRPQPACDSYNEFLEHLRSLKNNVNQGNEKKRKFMKRKLKSVPENGAGDNHKHFINPFACRSKPVNETNFESYLHRLRTALKIEVALTAWDFDSTTLAYQLTMIDKELFLKIRSYELQVITWQRSSKNAPNINSLIAFSHRISCLVATEILRDDSDKIRSRLIVRFINAADKCDRIANYQSCRSILNGLQSISIYRLYTTWAYLRLHHAMKYQLFENLCRQYSDPRLLIYQKSFYLASVSPPYLPYIGDILARLLDKVPPIPEYCITQITLDKTKINSELEDEKENMKRVSENKTKKVSHKIIKFFLNFKMWSSSSNDSSDEEKLQNNMEIDKEIIIESLPPKTKNFEINNNKYEDNRVQRLKEVMEFLDVCQKSAAKYALSKHDLAQEFLLRARYREDRENFSNLKVEHKLDAL